jgi:hypothetical protein
MLMDEINAPATPQGLLRAHARAVDFSMEKKRISRSGAAT